MAKTGRPAFRSQLDPNNPGPMDNAWCPIDEQSRLALPAVLTEGLTWTEGRTAECLLVLEPGGRVMLHEWTSRAEAIREKRKELIQAAENDAAAEQALATLEDRFRNATLHRRQLKLHRPVLG